MHILEAKKLTKTFGDFTAVDKISFHLEEGEILGMLGSNGAGKTTTIQMLLGVLTPTSGNVFYLGKSLQKHREEILEYVNFSSTYTNLPWWLTVKENLTFISYLYNIKNRKQRIAELKEIFRLEDIFYKTTSELSAGQITRVNLAKALLNSPKILLLDEPTASLDVEIARYIRQFLLEQRKNFQTSIVITSHNMEEVEELCDRVIVINHGNIVANDTPDKLAKSMKTSHIQLLLKKDMKKLEEYCDKHKISYTREGRSVLVDVVTETIPQFLKNIHDLGIYYDEISIEKPNLEDFFLQKIEEK